MNNNFNPVLLVMQPRGIPDVLDSIQKNVQIKTYLFQAYTEKTVCIAINDFISQTNYSHYIISADDIIYERDSMDAVLENSKKNITEVITGWVNLYMVNNNEYSEYSNICIKPLTLINQSCPIYDDYVFEKINNILNMTSSDLFTTYLTSFAFSCIPRQTILNYPMQGYAVNKNKQVASDHNFSSRYYKTERRVGLTNKHMFFKHLKQDPNISYTGYWLTGRIRPQIIGYL